MQVGWSGWELGEIERDGIRGYYGLNFPKMSEHSELLYERETDSNGYCDIRDIPPALYYVQAMKENRCSAISPLHPCCGGIRLTLSSTSTVRIVVKRKHAEGNPLAAFAFFDQSYVTLKSVDGKGGIFSGNLFSVGIIQFENVPFGTYHVTVSLPSEIFLQTRIDQDVQINSPQTLIELYVDDWKKYSVSGIVYDQDTGDPIENYCVLLQTQTGAVKQDIRQTDPKGAFEFQEVIPGTYNIWFKPNNRNQLTYLPLVENGPSGPYILKDEDIFMGEDISIGRNFASLTVQIVDRNVDDIKIPVKKIEETRFKGRVVYPDGNPVIGAILSVSVSSAELLTETQSAYTLPNDPTTDEMGCFEFSIIKNAFFNFSSCLFEITATICQEKSAYWEEQGYERGELKYKYIKKQLIPTGIGTVSVEGKSGDFFDNLNIVVITDIHKTVYGRLIAEESDYRSVELNGNQSSHELLIQIHQDGTFQIENVTTGPFLLKVNPHFHEACNTPYGIQSRSKYRYEKIELVMQDDKEEMYVDIYLRPNAYIWGVVSDAEGNPAKNVMLAIRDSKGTGYDIGQTLVDEQGFFFFGFCSLSPEETYSLHCYDIQNNTEIQSISNVRPTVENLQIIIP